MVCAHTCHALSPSYVYGKGHVAGASAEYKEPSEAEAAGLSAMTKALGDYQALHALDYMPCMH